MFLSLSHARAVALSELHRADFGVSSPLDAAAVLCSPRTEVGKTQALPYIGSFMKLGSCSLLAGRGRDRETEENETRKGEKKKNTTQKQNTNNFHSSEQERLPTPAPAADHSSHSSQLPDSKESTSPSYENMSSCSWATHQKTPWQGLRRILFLRMGMHFHSRTEISLITTEARSMVLRSLLLRMARALSNLITARTLTPSLTTGDAFKDYGSKHTNLSG